MSIILSGLIHLFRPLLSSLSGALDCEGLGPWYFLLGLRIVAIFFANGPWDKAKEDVACNWDQSLKDKSVAFCTALCHNQHFAISISATWGLVFLLCLLYVGLMRLSSPEEKKEGEKETAKEKEKEKDKSLAVVATAPHSGVADISTVYNVGPRGLPRRYEEDHPDYHYHDFPYHLYYPYHPYWRYWPRSHMGYMGEGYGPIVPYGPYETRGYDGGEHDMPGAGGYGTPGPGGYGTSGPGGYGTSGAGGYGTPGPGGYDTPGPGGYGTPGPGGYGTPGPGGYGTPGPGGYGTPGPGGYGTPGPGGYGMPGARGHGMPGPGGYGMPGARGYGMPGEGGHSVPTGGGYGLPPEVGLVLAEEEGHVMPDDEGRCVPAEEGHGVSANGGYSMPAGEGYSMPIHPEHTGNATVSAHCYNTAQRKMTTHQQDTSPVHGRMKQAKPPSRCDEKEQYRVPTKSVPAPINSSPYKRKYKSATKCRPVIESDMDSKGNAFQPWVDDKANTALKRRQVHGNNAASNSKSAGALGNQAPAQPWSAKDSNMAAQGGPAGSRRMTPGPGVPAGPPLCSHDDAGCTCAENTCEHTCQPCSSAESSNTKPTGSAPGAQDKAKKVITNLCGIPFFDIWVGFLLGTEIAFLCIILVLQMPSLLTRSWTCVPGGTSCPQSVECVVRGRAEKRVALWGLAITCFLFIVACSAYFYLRTCWNRACCKCCREENQENRVAAENTEPEGRVIRGDVESGSRESGGGQ